VALVNRAPQKEETTVVTTFLKALNAFLALYGIGRRSAARRRPAVYIGHQRPSRAG